VTTDLPAHQRHSETSTAAAGAIEPKAATLRRLVLEALRLRGQQGATDDELQEVLGSVGMSGNTQRPRRVELVRAGLVRDSGTTRPTRSGRRAVVWVVTA
jgi:hypothetical protein